MLFVLFAFFSALEATTYPCLTETTIENFYACKASHFGAASSNKYVTPTTQELTDIHDVALLMLNGYCTDINLPASMVGTFQVDTFTDGGSYCVLHEVNDANNDGILDKGRPSFFVNAAGTKNIAHVAPHDPSDLYTANQAAGLFRATSARALILSGARRDVSTTSSGCISGYTISDPSYTTMHAIFWLTKALNEYFGATNWVEHQWHGMGADSCTEDIFGSHGVNVAPTIDNVNRNIKNWLNVNRPTWNVGITGESSCTLAATTNVNGRYLNGVPEASVCTVAATTTTGKFTHWEQKAANRAAADWAPVIEAVYAESTPTIPAALTAAPGSRKITLGFQSVRAASPAGYTIERSDNVSPRSFAVVARNVLTTSYTDSNLVSKKSYCYRFTATNSFGVSPYSAEICATSK